MVDNLSHLLLLEPAGPLENVFPWPFVTILSRMGLAVAIGTFVGLEREHSQKTGVRTFSMAALLGCMGGLMGDIYAVVAAGFVALIIVGMNYREAIRHQKLVLTTSIALTVVTFAGILFGQGHVFTPATAGIIAATLLAWKRPIANFALGLSDQELRSAILLAILTFVILPVLPVHPVDPWGLVEPKSNWASVVIIAGIGFVNYILMKLYGPRGVELTAFFGGLVNSRKVIVELGMRLREVGTALLPSVHRGILLATAAMVVRNGLIVLLLAPLAFSACLLPLGLMLLVNMVLWWRLPALSSSAGSAPVLALESPFKLSAALKFGLVFLILNIVGILAQRHFGTASFYFVSIAGGLLSSASSIASAATLIAHHDLPASTGVIGIVLSSLTSVLSNVPLIQGLTDDNGLKRKAALALVMIAGTGILGMILSNFAIGINLLDGL